MLEARGFEYKLRAPAGKIRSQVIRVRFQGFITMVMLFLFFVYAKFVFAVIGKISLRVGLSRGRSPSLILSLSLSLRFTLRFSFLRTVSKDGPEVFFRTPYMKGMTSYRPQCPKP